MKPKNELRFHYFVHLPTTTLSFIHFCCIKYKFCSPRFEHICIRLIVLRWYGENINKTSDISLMGCNMVMCWQTNWAVKPHNDLKKAKGILAGEAIQNCLKIYLSSKLTHIQEKLSVHTPSHQSLLTSPNWVCSCYQALVFGDPSCHFFGGGGCFCRGWQRCRPILGFWLYQAYPSNQLHLLYTHRFDCIVLF